MLFIILSCVETKSYSGKLIDENFKYDSLLNKTQVTSKLGQPNFIDPIENKYYYYFEKRINKNIFDSRIEKRTMIVFNFEENENVQSFNQYNLNQEQQINFIKDKTKNNLIDRGLIEKIFGGIGKQKLSDNSQ
jgi:outer membrane protein assembly factor BamE (lipoprotein component of BamABCDE complex)|tara:strand:+ start:1242 stop:1640 length:399 start_codon:yes stop_codon:yes gene_type:complete